MQSWNMKFYDNVYQLLTEKLILENTHCLCSNTSKFCLLRQMPFWNWIFKTNDRKYTLKELEMTLSKYWKYIFQLSDYWQTGIPTRITVETETVHPSWMTFQLEGPFTSCEVSCPVKSHFPHLDIRCKPFNTQHW